MKHLLLLLFAASTIFTPGCRQSTKNVNAVNPILGDRSYSLSFGHSPLSSADERTRVRTHLAYVEGLLRQQPVSHLSPALQQQRAHVLALLHQYITAGVFPKNFDFPDRRVPCFIDKQGTICAVGYLIEQTAGRSAAEQINKTHKYEELLAMNDNLVDDWISTSGLTKREAAMIQPTYGYYPSPEPDIEKDYGISSTLLGAANVTFAAMNGIEMVRGKGASKAIPLLGIAGGIGQIVLGASSLPDETSSYNKSGNKELLSYLNIGIGTASILMSTWNLLTNTPFKDRRTSWNLYSVPTQDNRAVVGLSYTRKF